MGFHPNVRDISAAEFCHPKWLVFVAHQTTTKVAAHPPSHPSSHSQALASQIDPGPAPRTPPPAQRSTAVAGSKTNAVVEPHRHDRHAVAAVSYCAVDEIKSQKTRSVRATLPADIDCPVIVYHHGSQGMSDENGLTVSSLQKLWAVRLEGSGDSKGGALRANTVAPCGCRTANPEPVILKQRSP